MKNVFLYFAGIGLADSMSAIDNRTKTGYPRELGLGMHPRAGEILDMSDEHVYGIWMRVGNAAPGYKPARGGRDPSFRGRSVNDDRQILRSAFWDDITFDDNSENFQLSYDGQNYSGSFRAQYYSATMLDMYFYCDRSIQDDLIQRVLEAFEGHW